MQLCDLLSANNLDVHVFNPIITGQMHASSIRQTKNDRIDSRLICKIAFDNKFNSNYVYDPQREELKSISRFRSIIASDCSRIKIRLQSTLDYLFPEYNSLFKDKYGKLYIELLANYSLNEFAAFRIDKLTNICSKLSKGRKSKEFALQLHTYLKSNKLIETSHSKCLKLQMLAIHIFFLNEQLSLLEKEISILLNTINQNLTTIPGVGDVACAVIISEIGDLDNFSSPKKLVAFAGLDPKVYESGNYSLKRSHITKHGSAPLRHILFMCANAACLHSDEFKELYHRHKAKGKHHYVILNAIAAKLLHIIWGMNKNGTNYNSDLIL